jgi:diaminopimelate decarboxylase
MSSICYKENMLMCEEVPFAELAEEYGTPLYVYSKSRILENFRSMKAAFGEPGHTICYALKANSNPALLKVFAEEGAGADIVSAGELYLALKAGFSPDKIVFAGCGKREDEIEYALQKNIFAFNVESLQEVQTISRLATRLKLHARISFRINPHVDAQSHPFLTTGLNTNKFGIEEAKALEAYRYAATLPAVEIVGIHTHIGSQITRIEPFIETAHCIIDLVGKLREGGIQIRHIDFGGGFGVQYFNAIRHEALPVEDPAQDGVCSPADIFAAVLPVLKPAGCSVRIEPGRSLIADAGVFVTKVLYTKETSAKKFVIVDGGMNDLLRPSLYDAHHQIVPAVINTYENRLVDVVGPVCESGDFFARDRMLAKVGPGDILAVLTAGAYGFVNTSNYNGRLRPAEVMVNGERVRVIRARQTFEELT